MELQPFSSHFLVQNTIGRISNVLSNNAVSSFFLVSLKNRRISSSDGGYCVPYRRISIASRISMAAAEFDRLIAARDGSGLLAAEAYMIVHHPQWQRTRALIADENRGPTICGLARCNPADIEKVYEAVKGADKHRIHVFVATSAVHREFKLKMAKEEIIKSAVSAVKMARELVDDVEFQVQPRSVLLGVGLVIGVVPQRREPLAQPLAGLPAQVLLFRLEENRFWCPRLSMAKSASTGCYDFGMEYIGQAKYEKKTLDVSSERDCHQDCYDDDECRFFSYDSISKECHLKGDGGEKYKRGSVGFVSGPKRCEYVQESHFDFI